MNRSSASNLAPSRHDNPFATCWTRPGALPFRFVDGLNADQLIKKLAGQGWWGEIIGPHGSGKSTLLETLKPALAAAGRRVLVMNLRDRRHIIPPEFWHALRRDGHAPRVGGVARPRLRRRALSTTATAENGNLLLIVDGYEQLGRFARWRLMRRCRRAGAGLLVTSHALTDLPHLVRLAPDRCLIEQLVRELCAQVSVGITAEDVAASHACHGSNVREVFFELYDRHERLRRAAGTTAVVIA